METPIIWNSILVNQTLEKLRMGLPTNMSAFHSSDIELKAANLLYQLTPEEINEFHLCSRDIIYFVEKYCRFLTDTGRKVVDLRKYQKTILKLLSQEKFNEKIKDLVPAIRNLIIMASRQSGKTTTIAAFFSWYLCFHNDRNLAILANKQDTAYEIVSKVKDIFRGLPFFLKPGVISIGAGGIRLDNGCFLTSQATTKTAQIGYTIHVLYADEFAHIQPFIANDFWRSVYPTLASSEISQCIISSTPNGDDNVFYEIWDKAQKKQNSFYSIRVDWWEVPGHDEAWAEQMRKDFGDERFAQEFGLDFGAGASNLLLSPIDLLFMNKIQKDYEFHELEKTDLDDILYRNLKWHPDFDPNKDFNSKLDRFVLSIDTGEGKNEDEIKDNDYNICNIFHVTPKSIVQLKKLRNDEMRIKNMFKITQVGLYRDNIKDEENCAQVTRVITFDQFGSELCKVIIEMNFNGKHFLDKFSNHDDYDDSVVMHTYHTKPIPGEKPPRKKAGFKVTGANKDFYCKLGKRLVHQRILILNEKETIHEFKAFGKAKNGRWRGIGVHDDIAMSAVNVSHLYDEPEYEDWLFDFLDEMEDSPIKKMINELLEKYVESTDINDDTFASLYKDEEISPEKKIIPINQSGRYSPGYTFNKGSRAFPWKIG